MTRIDILEDDMHSMSEQYKKLKDAAKKLADALEYVEFDTDGYCRWCEGWDVHADACQRQTALLQYENTQCHEVE